MSSSEKAVFAADTRAGATNRFDFKETVGKKKTTGNIEIDSRAYINVHVGCQKKCGTDGKETTIEISIIKSLQVLWHIDI